jgi:hypothetical protein
MIRASDLSNAALWAARPATVSSRSGADTRDASTWFDGATVGSEARISADLNPASRGLSVEQHTNLILAQLCGER